MQISPEIRESLQATYAEELASLLPAGYRGIIVAELREDQSELETDYHAHRVTRRVVIGFAKSSRSLFPNMRKAAATFTPTAHLSEKNAENEHRENYSMGGGTYLKGGYRHSCGWSISIEDVKWAGSDTGAFSKAIGGEAL